MGENLLQIFLDRTVLRSECMGLSEVINGLVSPTQHDEGYPEVIVRLRTMWIDAKGLPQMRPGLPRLSLLNG